MMFKSIRCRVLAVTFGTLEFSVNKHKKIIQVYFDYSPSKYYKERFKR